MARRRTSNGIPTYQYAQPAQQNYDVPYQAGEVPGYDPGAEPSTTPAPRVTPLSNGGIMTTNDPTVGLPTADGQSVDGYGNPVTASPTNTYKSQLRGFDEGKLNDPNKINPKYVFGRTAQNYDVTDPAQRLALLEALKADPSGFFKNATLGGSKGDILSYSGWEGDNGQIDIGEGFGAGGTGWQWAPIGMDEPTQIDTGDEATPVPGTPSSGGYVGGVPAVTKSSSTTLDQVLEQILSSGGNFNQDLVNQRVNSARDELGRTRSSMGASTKDELADRGQMGSGGESDALTRLDEQLGSAYGSEVSGLYSDEMANADSRLMQALTVGAGLDTSRAQNIVDQYNAETNRTGVVGNLNLGQSRIDLDRMLGMGGLDLSRTGQELDWNKFLAQFGLDRERLQFDQENGGIDQILALLQQLGMVPQTASNGQV